MQQLAGDPGSRSDQVIKSERTKLHVVKSERTKLHVIKSERTKLHSERYVEKRRADQQ